MRFKNQINNNSKKGEKTMTTEIKHKSFFMKQTIKVLSICLLALSIISCSDDPKVFGNKNS